VQHQEPASIFMPTRENTIVAGIAAMPDARIARSRPTNKEVVELTYCVRW